eukprot:3753689-Pleurochrysis_carterae.AAC.1
MACTGMLAHASQFVDYASPPRTQQRALKSACLCAWANVCALDTTCAREYVESSTSSALLSNDVES